MEVEVVFPSICGAFYPANVLDIDLEKGSILVTFEKKWKPDSWVPMANVRKALPRSPFKSGAEVGLQIEAYLPHHNEEPSGWWMGTLSKSKGELHVVEFQSGTEKFSDIVELENLRLPNQSPPFSKVKYYQDEFSVPEDIAKFAQQPQLHRRFVKKIGAVCAKLDQSTSKLVVTADDEDALQKACLLIDIHLADLSIQMGFLQRTQKQPQQKTFGRAESGLIEVQFHVPRDLIGLAIGKNGSNINSAREVPGVRYITVDDNTSSFTIQGESVEAVNKARSIMEFTKDTVVVEKSLAGHVIGKNGKSIQKICEKSRVISMRVVQDEDSSHPADQVAFDIIGPKKCVEDAKLIFEFHVEELKDMEQLIEEGYPSDTQTYFPRPGESSGYTTYRGGFNRRGGRGRPSKRADEMRQDGETNDSGEQQEEDQAVTNDGENGQTSAEPEKTQEGDEKAGSSSPDVEEVKGGNEGGSGASSPSQSNNQAPPPDRRRPHNQNGSSSPDVEEVKEGNEGGSVASSPSQSNNQAPPPDRRRPQYQNNRRGGYQSYGRGQYSSYSRPQRQYQGGYNGRGRGQATTGGNAGGYRGQTTTNGNAGRYRGQATTNGNAGGYSKGRGQATTNGNAGQVTTGDDAGGYSKGRRQATTNGDEPTIKNA